MEIPVSAGMATALNFQVVGNRVATTGDFALIADEVNPVIQALESHGISVTALHSHMCGRRLACSSCTSGPSTTPGVSRKG